MNFLKSYSGKNCCVPGCATDQEENKSVLHRFPNPVKNKELFDTWVSAVGGDILSLTSAQIYQNRRVCRSHFENKHLMRNSRITNIAVPTLNMPDSLEKIKSKVVQKLPMQSIENIPSTSKDRETPCIIEENPVLHVPQEPIPQLPKAPMSHELVNNHVIASSKKDAIKKTTRRMLMTKNEIQLHAKIVAAKVKISKMKNKLKKQSAELKLAKKMSTDSIILKAVENCSTTAKLLMTMQCRENRKKTQGRRFSLKEKIAALSILKQSPKGYRFFRKIFILPAPQTLIKLVQRANLHPGINANIFKQLQKMGSTMTITDKLCILMFDEIALKAHIDYSEKKDKVTGFTDNGKERVAEYADHAQVFMIRGVIKNYKQVVNYTFAKNATKGPELANQIKSVITELQNAGFTVVATVCDQGTNNRTAINILAHEAKGIYLRRGDDISRLPNVMLINDSEIIPLYDPPHLLKGIRNNMLNKKLKYVKDGITKTAEWAHLQLLHKENPGYRGFRMIPKLTEQHVNPEKFNKMKVKFASQIFSRTVASNMGYLADKGILPENCKGTADFLLFMDNLFDSVNGSFLKNKHAKPLLGPATPSSAHIKCWAESKKILKTIKFETASGKKEYVPSVNNWVWTLDGMEYLLKSLKDKYGISSVWMRHLNQDPLENFFGSVRSHGCRNNNPTCEQFESAYTTLLVNNLNNLNSKNKNCEGDFCDALHALVIEENPDAPSTTCPINFDNILDVNFTSVQEKEKYPKIIAPLQYVSGYVLKKVKTNVFKDCAECKVDFISIEECEYIKYREYAGRRWLFTPSKGLVELMSSLQDVMNHVLKNKLENSNIKTIMKTAISVLIDFNIIKCQVHKKKIIDYIINFTAKMTIFTYCKNINKILDGKRSDVDEENDNFQLMALEYRKKCLKRKK